jgi:hypothetical protein
MAKGTVDLTQWFNSHDRAPKGRGGWIFLNEQGDELNYNGTYSEASGAALKDHPGQTLVLMP